MIAHDVDCVGDKAYGLATDVDDGFQNNVINYPENRDDDAEFFDADFRIHPERDDQEQMPDDGDNGCGVLIGENAGNRKENAEKHWDELAAQEFRLSLEIVNRQHYGEKDAASCAAVAAQKQIMGRIQYVNCNVEN